ncbi:MAG: SGNH/GDSL hydrolase family protein [Deltaproteobacteria bacterium]|nr:SGNH/GDSL hydrolase family protein [Deltaproteobacteria bacterium]
MKPNRLHGLVRLGASVVVLCLVANQAAAAPPKAPSASKLVFSSQDKLVIIGDSVTDAGRKPAGEGLFDALGKGWVALVDGLLSNLYPQLAVRVVNKGTSGNTTRDLLKRWQDDVIAGKPQWVAVFIGINDVWRQFDVPRIPEDAVPIDEYERNLESMITATLPNVKGMILMTPFYMEPNKADKMRIAMDRYGAVVRKLATKYKTRFVDTQAAFDELMLHHYPATIAWDRIHPNHIGTMALARAFLNAVGFDWSLAAAR